MSMETRELTTVEIVALIEAGNTVRLPCYSVEEANSLRNNITSRLYKQRTAIKQIDNFEFQSVLSKILLDEADGYVIGIEFRLGNKEKATFKCTIIPPAESSNG